MCLVFLPAMHGPVIMSDSVHNYYIQAPSVGRTDSLVFAKNSTVSGSHILAMWANFN